MLDHIITDTLRVGARIVAKATLELGKQQRPTGSIDSEVYVVTTTEMTGHSPDGATHGRN